MTFLFYWGISEPYQIIRKFEKVLNFGGKIMIKYAAFNVYQKCYNIAYKYYNIASKYSNVTKGLDGTVG